MTVNRNNRLILIAVLVFLTAASAFSFAAVKKNILRIHFQTAVVKKTTIDTILNVNYKLEINNPPVTFRGFDCRFIFEDTAIAPIPMDQQNGLWTGTACANAFIHEGTRPAGSQEYRVEVLSDKSLDTTNKILFQIRYAVKRFVDSAVIIPTRFDPIGSGIDTVIIDNAPGRDAISWYQFALLYADTTKPVPVKKVDILLSSDSVRIDSNTERTFSVMASSLDSAKIKSGKFSFDLDTSAFDSASITPGLLLASATFSDSIKGSNVAFEFSQNDSLTGSGELLKITLRGRKRKDTVCTFLLNPQFNVTNTDNLLNAAVFNFQKICVFGKKDTVIKGVVTQREEPTIEIYPNPAQTYTEIVVSGTGKMKSHFDVFDLLGREVAREAFENSFHWDTSLIPSGTYMVSISNEGWSSKQQIVIIH